MNILVLGSGGREHALCWKIKQSPLCHTLYCLPGNAGIANESICLPGRAEDIETVLNTCEDKDIDFVVVGPEAPLVIGMVDALRANGIDCFGPTQSAAVLEGSKGFMKDLCADYNIPTADYARFTHTQEALEALPRFGLPVVIKADGLAAGKGVIIAETTEQAEDAIKDMLDGNSFGSAGAEIVIEEFMDGEEVSFFALCDGHTALPLITAQDHKRAFDGDEGPNTGGMGAYSPAPLESATFIQTVMETIIHPTVQAMKDKAMPYTGVLYAGLMVTNQGIKLLEYNVRFGDPECQVLMQRLQSDIVPLLMATSNDALHEEQPTWHPEPAMCVVIASKGYPGSYEKNTPIYDLDKAGQIATVFHAGTAMAEDGTILATGGRVLGITAMDKDLQSAKEKAYKAIEHFTWENGFYRQDIGWRAIQRKAS